MLPGVLLGACAMQHALLADTCLFSCSTAVGSVPHVQSCASQFALIFMIKGWQSGSGPYLQVQQLLKASEGMETYTDATPLRLLPCDEACQKAKASIYPPLLSCCSSRLDCRVSIHACVLKFLIATHSNS